MTTYIKGTFPVRFRRDGKDGVGINSVNTYYALGDSLTVSPSDSKYIYDTLTDVVISTNSGSYVWSGDKIMYTNGNASLTGKYCIGKCSELASVTEQYGTSSSATTEPTYWSDSYPTSLPSGIYIWTRDKIVWKNNDITHSTAKKAGYIAKDGELGFGFVASVERNGNFSEAEWNDTYGKPGHNETWVNTSSIRNGCRVGDIFQVIGYASDTLNMHTAYYRSTTASDNLTGTCISHSVAERGQQGSPGEDAYSYRLTSQISSIPLNNDGTPSITSFWLQAYIYKGSTSQTVTSSYKLRYEIWRAGQTSYSSYGQGGTNGKLSVSVNSSYTDIVKISCYFKDDSGKVLDSFDILPVKAGAAGVSYFPNMCGVWDGANVTYKWTNGSRDMVTYYISGTPYLFAVKTAGTTISANVKNATPDKDSRWEKADSPFSMLFANFVYTDNASVAGFVWSADKMKSSSGLLEIDGKNGTIKCSSVELTGTINATGGTIGEFVIRDKGLGLACTADEADILMTCQSNNKRKARIYVTPKYDNAVISASTDTTTAAEFTASQSSGTALSVIGKTNINGAVNIQGNVELSGTLSGLRLSATTMSSGGTISPSYDVICFNNTSAITVTLPSASTYKGRMLFLKKLGSGSVTLNGTIIPANGTGSTTTAGSVGANKSMMYISNGSAWIEYYCG